MTKDDLRKLSAEQLRALSDGEFWDAVEPEGVCPDCDQRLGAEARRRNERERRARRLSSMWRSV
jgi:hypothetical protein